MPENYEEWFALAAFVVTIVAAFTDEVELMFLACAMSLLFGIFVLKTGR